MSDRIDEARKRVVDAVRKARDVFLEESEIARALDALGALEGPLVYETVCHLTEQMQHANGVGALEFRGLDDVGNDVDVRVESRSLAGLPISGSNRYSIKIAEILKG